MFVVATAGHVDHGKSTLVRALTGMDPDRWDEEKRRGLTIDLGFAWTTLPGGASLAFVDVPGHERFMTNMLAGVGPCPAVLLVVAADEGWCRQTSEHLAALDALGVEHGVLAVTRSDLGDADLAEDEARTFLAGTTLADIPAVAVSPVTGAGLDELRSALAAMVDGLPATTSASTRLWVDRVFTVRGAGTVVTGTLSSGALAVGDTLAVMPGDGRVTVRGLQSLGREVDGVAATARVAVNLRSVPAERIRRGDALVAARQWLEVSIVDVRLTRAVPRLPRDAVLHVGSAPVPVTVRPLGVDGARLELGRPLPLHVGDRALLRDPGRQEIVAGVVVLDVDPPPLRRRGAAAARARELVGMRAEPDVAAEVARRGAVRRSTLLAMGVSAPMPHDVVGHGDWWIARPTWTQWSRRLDAVLAERAAEHPLTPAVSVNALARDLELPDPVLVTALVEENDELVLDADGVHRAGVSATLPAGARQALDEVLARLGQRPFAAPEAEELQASGLTGAHLAVAVRQAELIRLAPGVFLRPDAPDLAAEVLAGLPAPFTLSQARQALDTTRRVGVPLLELLDRRGVTQRLNGTERRLADTDVSATPHRRGSGVTGG